MIGLLALSMAGHDKDNVYVIIKEENNFVYLADGNLRKIESPKKKNIKHIQLVKKYSHANLEFSNESIKKIIKNYKKSK